MRNKLRKTLIIAVKLAISAALLGWVLSKVHWHDFVVLADGQGELSVQKVAAAGPGRFRVEYPDGRSEEFAADQLTPASGVSAEITAVEAFVHPGFRNTLKSLKPWLLVLAVACQGLSVLLISYRWWRLLHVQGIDVRLWEAVRLTFLGTFFNQIVLGTTGGDLVKAWYLSRHVGSKTTCLITVLVDRVLGLTGLTLLSAIMLAVLGAGLAMGKIQLEHQAALAQAGILCAVVLGGLVGGCVLMFSRRLRRWLRLERLFQRLPLANQLIRANRVLHRYRHAPLAMLRAMWHTFLAQVAFIGCIVLLGRALGLAIPWYQYFVYVPLIYIIASIPIVPGGVGLAEGSFVTFFAVWATQSEILALALLARLVPMFWALPGVVVAVTGPKIPPAAELEAELAVPAPQSPDAAAVEQS